MAQDEVQRTAALLAESRDVYIPSLVVNGGAGQSYGITLSVPTILTVNAQSLVYSSAQRSYTRAARLGFEAAKQSLTDAREGVEEDVLVTYMTLTYTEQMEAVAAEQYGHAQALQRIVEQRRDAGLESSLDAKQAQRQAVQMRLQALQLHNQAEGLRDHLAELTAMPADSLTLVPESLPNDFAVTHTAAAFFAPAEAAATLDARSKQQQALGDAHTQWRPVVGFAAQYGRVSPINDVTTYYNLQGKYNVAYGAIQIQFPVIDAVRRAHARESNALAAHAAHQTDLLLSQDAEEVRRLRRTVPELEAKADLADLDASIAAEQLHRTLVDATTGGDQGSGPVLTPKETENAYIAGEQKQVDALDARVQWKKTQITLLRRGGVLEAWWKAQTGVPQAGASQASVPQGSSTLQPSVKPIP